MMAEYSEQSGGSRPLSVSSQPASSSPAEAPSRSQDTPGYGAVTSGSYGSGMETHRTSAVEGAPTAGAGAPQDDTIGQVREQARNLASKAREQSSELTGQAKQQVNTLITEQKAKAAERLGSIAGVLREAADKLGIDELGGRVGRYANQAADQMESVSRYVRGTDIQTFFRDTGQFARRRPEVFLATTFLTGLLAARFLKASVEHVRQPDMPAGGR